MNKKDNSTDVLQVGAEEQLDNGKSVVDLISECTHSFLAALGDKLPKKVRYSIDYLEAKKKGIRVAFFKYNREVNYSHIKELYRDVKDSKRFSLGCYVVPLQPILEKYPDLEVLDLKGNSVTLESMDIDLYLAVYDGQHRITVCELYPGEVDVELEIFDFDGVKPLDSIKKMNSYSRNWNSTDLRSSNVNANLTANKLYEKAANLQTLYGLTPKASEYVLTFNREATKKKDLITGRDTTTYDEEKGKRGKGIIDAAMMVSKGDKDFKKIQFIDGIVYVYNETPDKDKGNFALYMKLYIGTLVESKIAELKSSISNKNYGDLNDLLSEGYIAFCKANSTNEELSKMESDVNSKITQNIENLQKEEKTSSSRKMLKQGRVNDIIRHNQEVQRTISTEKLEKAKTKTAKAQKEEKDAQAEVDKLKRHQLNN